MDTSVLEKDSQIDEGTQDSEAVDVLERAAHRLDGKALDAHEAAMADMRSELENGNGKGLGHVAMRAVEAHPLTQDDAAAKVAGPKEQVAYTVTPEAPVAYATQGASVMTPGEREAIMSGEQNRK